MSGRTADFFNCSPVYPTHTKRASWSAGAPTEINQIHQPTHDRRASWHPGQPSMLPIPDQTVQESEEDKVSAMEARLNAACFDLSGHEPEQGPSVWDPDSESNAEGDSAFPSDNDEGWTSPEDSPLPTPLHSPLVDARPLKSAIRNGDSASSSETSSITSHDGQNKDRKGSFVSFQDEPQILSTWAPTDYARGGPLPNQRLGVRELLELRELQIECSLVNNVKGLDALYPLAQPSPPFIPPPPPKEHLEPQTSFLRLN